MQWDQMGGTTVAAIGRLCKIGMDMGSDQTGLARWSWIKIGSGICKTRVVRSYLLL